ncbi:MAG: phage antirepressor KilAC domain-containing protein, partial [Ruminococcus sp.]|nr:phage antirepressor KilAC domain-containing protein [Ruminococcus sp.]
ATVLGYTDTINAIKRHVDSEDKAGCQIATQFGVKETTIINESGLYSLVLSSKLPNAKKFKRWVTNEVLPSIRKHGAYMTEQTLERALTSPDFLIELATQLKAEQEQRKQLETTVAVQEQQIAELQPKASYYDVVLNCKDLLSITSIAKDYGKSGVWLNRYLHQNGVQYKQGNNWLLYQKYAEKGYTSTKTQTFPGADGQQHTKVHTYWTQKGRLFIYDLLKANGLLPLIEQEAI